MYKLTEEITASEVKEQELKNGKSSPNEKIIAKVIN